MPRLLIFNLPREATSDAVRALVEGWRRRGDGTPGARNATIDLHAIPGAEREVFAVVHLTDNRRHARALARHLNGCRRAEGLRLDRPLWSWLPAMAWG